MGIYHPPPEKETAAPSGIGNGGEGNVQTDDANPGQALNQAANRAIGAGLKCEADARHLALVLCHRLTEPQCLHLIASAAWALPPRIASQMARAIQADAARCLTIPHDRVAPTVTLEAERQRRAWAA